MKSGPLHILIAVFLMLLGGVFTDRSLKSTPSQNLLFPLQTAQVQEIRLEYLLDGILLFKENGEWKVKKTISVLKKKLDDSEGKTSIEEESSYLADEAKIEHFLGELSNLNKNEIASIHPEQYPQLQVNEALGFKIELKTPQQITSLLIGKPLVFGKTFVRKAEDSGPEVYRIPDSLRPLRALPEDWKKQASVSLSQ